MLSDKLTVLAGGGSFTLGRPKDFKISEGLSKMTPKYFGGYTVLVSFDLMNIELLNADS
jgi:hypothetical protein